LFKITMTSRNGHDADARIKLERLGFTFEPHGPKSNPSKWWRSEQQEVGYEINTIEELVAFVETYGDVVISAGQKIEIYNDYRE